MPNLKDVARLADVDPSTASRVLRGDPSQAVRSETRERILVAARTLDYSPNALARGLRTRRTDTIGLIIPSLENVGFTDATRGIQAAAAAAGKLVVVVEAGALRGSATAADEHYARLLTDGRIDGLILAFATLEDHFVARLAVRDIPLVLVNRRTSGVHASVVVDDEAGMRVATGHLVESGHRRIALIGLDEETDTAHRREAGYRQALANAGLRFDKRLVTNAAPTEEGGRGAAAALLAQPGERPTAIVAASLRGAIGALAGLREASLAVPADVSLVAFNDHPVAAHLATPLTTVRMPNFRMGQQAVRMLLRAAEGGPVSDLMIEDPPELVVRASTAPPS